MVIIEHFKSRKKSHKAKKEIEAKAASITMICRDCGQEVTVLELIAEERNGLCSVCYHTRNDPATLPNV